MKAMSHKQMMVAIARGNSHHKETMKLRRNVLLIACAVTGIFGMGNQTACASFLPSNSDPNLVLWLDADAIGQANGTPVSSWNDSGPSNNDAVQGNLSLQPTYVASSPTFNNKPVVHFDGLDDFLDAVTPSSITAGTEMTLFVLWKLDQTGFQREGIENWNGSNGFLLNDQGSPAVFRWYIAPAGSAADGGNSAMAVLQPVVMEGFRNATTLALYTNGIQVASVGSGGGAIAGSSTLRIGGRPSPGGGTFFGEIQEILIYDRALTTQEQADINSYLLEQIPEPSSVALLGLGGALLLWRRRN